MKLKKSKAAKRDSAKPPADLKHQLAAAGRLMGRYQGVIIGLVVVVLLGLTTLKMQHYIDPEADADKATENQKKVKVIVIDQKAIERIKQLADSGTQPAPQFVDRNNPFTEQ